MSVLRRFSNPVTEPFDSPDLTLAQWRALSRQIPLMYAMLVTNTIIVAWTHLDVAPAVLTIYIPALLILIAVVRTMLWSRGRNAEITPDMARRKLRALIWIGAVIAIGFTGWSVSLLPYGDAYLQSQIAFYMGITTIGCMFCLMHVRAAVLAVGICVLVPFTAVFIASGQATFIAIAVNMVLVISVLLLILLENNKDFAALVASRNDMTRRQQETQRLLDENHRLANVDGLTGLPNRRSFDTYLAQSLHKAAAEHSTIAVARIDIDQFKSINGIFGQLTGDRILFEVARRIQAIRRPETFVARLEGDSFVLIMQEPADTAAMARCGKLLCDTMRIAFDTPEGVVRLSASAGFAASRPGDTTFSLFDRADYATSVAKREARGSAVVFGDCHDREIAHVRRIEHLLHSADLDEEIYILLQPQVDISLGATTGFEVLARWRSPVLGEVPPVEFIPLAERTGLIGKLTQTVLRKALAVTADIPRPLRVSVNLSASDIGSPSAIERISSMVRASSVAGRIDFEITETALMHDLVQAHDALMALLGLGARIALDDFGTGHSSLTHAQKLPLHRIKIDRSFVSEITSDPTSRAIVKTMADLARNLGISCVFEGIETEEQLRELVALGGTIMQGYLLGRPMPPEKIPEYLAREKSLRHLEGWGESAAS